MGRAVGAERGRLTASELVRYSLRGRRLDLGGRLFEGALLLSLLLALGFLLVLLQDVVRTGTPVLAERRLDFVTSGLSSLPSRAGVWQALTGSLTLMVVVVLVAFPLGIAAAIYMEEYARDTGVTRFINANIRNLAGVPSVVYGLLGLAIFVRFFHGFTSKSEPFTLIAGGLTLAVLVLPIVIITSAEALRAVPQSIREAGFGVGATRWEVIRGHVLPYAAPGILTGTVLSIARALGEAAPLIIVGGAISGFLATSGNFADSFTDRYTAMPALIYSWSRKSLREFGDLVAAAIIVLLVVLLLINATAILLRNRYERKW
jgi:phosphate transport system permease protein